MRLSWLLLLVVHQEGKAQTPPVGVLTLLTCLSPVARRLISGSMYDVYLALPDCRIQELDLTEKAVAAVVRFSRDESHAARHAAARAAGHLALAELQGQLEQDTALKRLIPVMVALVGTDQSSDVQRQMLLVGMPAPACHLLAYMLDHINAPSTRAHCVCAGFAEDFSPEGRCAGAAPDISGAAHRQPSAADPGSYQACR